MASATVTRKPSGTTTAGGWSRTGGTTVDGVLTDASDATFMWNSNGADAVCTLPAPPASVNLAAITQVNADARGFGKSAGSDIGHGVAVGVNYRSVNSSGALGGTTVAWRPTSSSTIANKTSTNPVYGSTVPSKNDLNAMTLILTGLVGGGYTASDVGIDEGDVIIAYDPLPVIGMHPGF